MATLASRAVRSERGQAIIEMALTLPLLLLIIMGIFDFGLMFQRYEVVTNAAREGGRVGVLADYTPDLARLRALDYLAVGGLNGAVRGSVANCDQAFAPGTRCVSAVVSNTTITGSSPARTVEQITVTVDYDYEYNFVGPIMTLFGGSLGDSRLRAVTTMRLESN